MAAVIVIDPGHGGFQKIRGSSPNNATSRSGVLEKTMALRLALKIRDEIEAFNQKQFGDGSNEKIDVQLTRTRDVNLGLADRANLARIAQASVFLSIHFNSFDGTVRGTEAWIDRKYRSPHKVNQAGTIKSITEGPGQPISGIRNVNHVDDAAFASAVAMATSQAISKHDIAAKTRSTIYYAQHHGESYSPPEGVKMKRLDVLRDSALGSHVSGCCACLLEVEFIDHPAVDELFNGPDGDKVEKSLARAIARVLIDHA